MCDQKEANRTFISPVQTFWDWTPSSFKYCDVTHVRDVLTYESLLYLFSLFLRGCQDSEKDRVSNEKEREREGKKERDKLERQKKIMKTKVYPSKSYTRTHKEKESPGEREKQIENRTKR